MILIDIFITIFLYINYNDSTLYSPNSSSNCSSVTPKKHPHILKPDTKKTPLSERSITKKNAAYMSFDNWKKMI